MSGRIPVSRIRDLLVDVLDASDTTTAEKLRAAEKLLELGGGDELDEAVLGRAREMQGMDGGDLAQNIVDFFRETASASTSPPGPATRALTFGEQAAARIDALEAQLRDLRAELAAVTAQRDEYAHAAAEQHDEAQARQQLPAPPLQLPAAP
jgi:hypothetical protein